MENENIIIIDQLSFSYQREEEEQKKKAVDQEFKEGTTYCSKQFLNWASSLPAAP